MPRRRTLLLSAALALLTAAGALWWVVTPSRTRVPLVRGQISPERLAAHCDGAVGPPRVERITDRVLLAIGHDLASTILVRTDVGHVIVDVGMSPARAAETRAALLAAAPGEVAAVIYTHSHIDHYGGVRGVVDEADVKSGKVTIVAPVGFMKAAVAENVYAGNAMNRRLFFQYGVLLPRSPFGHVDQSIGKNTAAGTLGLIAPTRIVEKPIEEITIDGVTMVFQNTPGTEAPAEMNTWFPQFKAFWAAENVTGTIHNIYTLRGALVRDALEWSKKINEALYRFGQDAEVMFAAHSWPRFGNARIQEVMRTQRDAYANLNNQVLHLANQGVTINEVHNVYRLPASLQKQWAAHSYHGSEEHNSRAVINRYLGYWDGNPATLTPLSPGDSAPLYVEMMGGAKKILAKGRELYDAGKYLYAVEILNKLVYAEPENQDAKDLLADAFEQIGYQKESPSVRNSFLAAAYELRSGMPAGIPPSSVGPDTVRAMPTDLWLDFLAIRLDAPKAEGMHATINLVTPDNGERFAVELSNSALTSIKGVQAKNPDLTLTIDRADLETVMAGKATLEQQIDAGKAKAVGDRGVLGRLRGLLTTFTPDFQLMPGTKRPPQPAAGDPFALPESPRSDGG